MFGCIKLCNWNFLRINERKWLVMYRLLCDRRLECESCFTGYCCCCETVIMNCNQAVTPSTVFYDSEVSSDVPASRFDFPHTAVTENSMTRSVTTAPVAIPGAKGSRTRTQRHTNFTPPRSYVGIIEKSMVRSKSAGSLSTAVSFLVAEHVHPVQSQGIIITPWQL